MNAKLSMKEFAERLKNKPETEKEKQYARLTAVSVEQVAVVSQATAAGWAWT